MAGIFGLLGINDTDRAFRIVEGQQQVFEATNEWLRMVSEDFRQQMNIFVEMDTEAFKERYYLPGGGRLQRRGGQTESAATKASGSWDVAYPLEDFGAQLTGDDVSLAYMSMAEYQRHFDTLTIQDMNTIRYEILHAILDDEGGSARTFADPIHGDLSIKPLANADSDNYPPVLGSETDTSSHDHYNESGYAAASISDTNNPLVTIRNHLEEHFGAGTGGENIAVFCNNAQSTQLEDLTDFDTVVDQFIRAGDNRDVPERLPAVPGRILGRSNGVWVIEWRWIPANYLVGIHLDAPAPLKMRVDPADTGLPRGLQMVATSDAHPLQAAHYRHRFGLGVGNRLNGTVYELGTSGSYTIPTAYD